jgi:hypothetical protein
VDAASAGHRSARMMMRGAALKTALWRPSKRAPGNFCARYVAPGRRAATFTVASQRGRANQQGSRLSASPQCTRAAAAGRGA